jgi:hypothetical protein
MEKLIVYVFDFQNLKFRKFKRGQQRLVLEVIPEDVVSSTTECESLEGRKVVVAIEREPCHLHIQSQSQGVEASHAVEKLSVTRSQPVGIRSFAPFEEAMSSQLVQTSVQ